MPPLLDSSTRDSFKKRVQALTAATKPTWGKMSVDQMLHHVNLSIAESLGEHTAARSIKGLPEWLIRLMILKGPWGKGAPTRPDMFIPAGDRFDFATEQKRLLDMIDRFCAKSPAAEWPRAANFAMTGTHWCQLQGRHIDHHMRQFGV
jgi:hypothetical protein